MTKQPSELTTACFDIGCAASKVHGASCLADDCELAHDHNPIRTHQPSRDGLGSQYNQGLADNLPLYGITWDIYAGGMKQDGAHQNSFR